MILSNDPCVADSEPDNMAFQRSIAMFASARQMTVVLWSPEDEEGVGGFTGLCVKDVNDSPHPQN